MIPTEALDYKIRAVQFWRKCRPFIGRIREAPSEELWDADLVLMRLAMPIIWPDHFAQVALVGADQLMHEKQQQMQLKGLDTYGFWHMLDKPLFDVFVDGDSRPIDSILVRPSSFTDRNTSGVQFRAFNSDMGYPQQVLFFDIYERETVINALKRFKVEFEDDPTAIKEISKVLFLVWAFDLFLEQKVLVSDSVTPERAARKRALKEEIPAEVRVIRLRKTVQGEHQHTQAEIEWHCRWMVRGHWRQQFHPSDGSHQLTWIMPYVKGPEDKPFRRPLPEVSVVVR